MNYITIHDRVGQKIYIKGYRYNMHIKKKTLLVEVGNNKNTIEEARACGEYFADVLSEIIEEEQ